MLIQSKGFTPHMVISDSLSGSAHIGMVTAKIKKRLMSLFLSLLSFNKHIADHKETGELKHGYY
jgi:hypothetical protein